MTVQITTSRPENPTNTRAGATRVMLWAGAVAGPLYLIVGFAQALTRDGFDLTRHPFSSLSLGDLGWLQIANFVVCGALFIAGAVGIRRARGGTWGPRLIGAMGVGMIAGGVFTADPAFGFPAGAPDGQPEALSWHGTLHGVAFGVAILSWTVACFVFARRFAAAGERGWAAYCAATGVLLLAPLPFLGTGLGVVLLYVVATIGWSWTSVLIGRLLVSQRR